jgi:hypothetical protein
MKKLRTIVRVDFCFVSGLRFYIALLILMCISCSGRDDEIKQEKVLPKITLAGLDRAGCLVDGRVFLSNNLDNPGLFNDPRLDYSRYSDTFITISLSEVSEYERIEIVVHNPAIQEEHSLFQEDKDNNTRFENGAKRYFMVSDLPGTLKFMRNDDSVAAGVFSFQAVLKGGGDTIHITEGRFDIQK